MMRTASSRIWPLGAAALLLCLACTLQGCGKADKGDADDKESGAAKSAPAEAKAAAKDDKPDQIEVTEEQARNIGLKTATPKSAQYADEAPGYGSILAHENIAAAVAEVATAEAAEKQSQSALARTRRLAGTPGALSSDVEEANVRQAAVDDTALSLARQRLTASLGQDPPWHGDSHAAILKALASGTDKLVRVTFPLGTALADSPKALRISHLGSGVANPRFTVAPLWRAPADSSVPGRSFFGVIRGAEFAEGERVVAWTPVGKLRAGVVVPAAAVVVTDNKYWCYLAKDQKTFVRTEIDAGIPLDDGYFVASGIKSDDHIVVNGAALLLSQETSSGPEDD